MLTLNDYYIRSFLERWLAEQDGGGDKRLLDLGCGAKSYMPLYSDVFSFATGLDPDQNSAAEVRAVSQRLPFPNGSFDCVLATEVLEHVPEYGLAVQEIARVLRPGGQVLITWPLCYQLHDVPHDYCRFTEFRMEQLLRQTGLNVEVLFRRGDLFAVMLMCAVVLGANALEALRRIPAIGFLLRPLTRLGDLVLQLACQAFAKSSKNWRRLNPDGVGEHLDGTGSLALWTLGYCVVARKTG